MEARSSGHLDACVERRRDALLGRRVTGAERGCALRFEGKVLAATKRKATNFDPRSFNQISPSPSSPHRFFLIFRNNKSYTKDSDIRVSLLYMTYIRYRTYFNFSKSLNLNREK